jgi:hypothetical protein
VTSEPREHKYGVVIPDDECMHVPTDRLYLCALCGRVVHPQEPQAHAAPVPADPASRDGHTEALRERIARVVRNATWALIGMGEGDPQYVNQSAERYAFALLPLVVAYGDERGWRDAATAVRGTAPVVRASELDLWPREAVVSLLEKLAAEYEARADELGRRP